MRGKRAKAYKKLMASYSQSFGFREPYQVLLDDTIILDAVKFKMDLAKALEQTLRGKVKPLITQCCIRQLYALSSKPEPPSDKKKGDDEHVPIAVAKAAVTVAKTFERRRCNHSISEEALSSMDCLRSVILPDLKNATSSTTSKTKKKNKTTDALAIAEKELGQDSDEDEEEEDASSDEQSQQQQLKEDEGRQLSRLEALRQRSKSYNKHRYILATDSPAVRAYFRDFPGIPGIHIKRSVMVMDTMSEASSDHRFAEEKEKMRQGLKNRVVNRKRGADDDEDEGLYKRRNHAEDDDGEQNGKGPAGEERIRKRRRLQGPKQPNPLSVMKKKKDKKTVLPSIYKMNPTSRPQNDVDGSAAATAENKKTRRKRKKRGAGGAAAGGGEAIATATNAGGE